MDHKAIMQSAIQREKTPYLPVAFWRHFPVDDQRPGTLAKVTLAFQEMFDFDFVKVSPPSSFCLKDWGAQDEWFADPEGTRDYLGSVIQHRKTGLKSTYLILAPVILASLECLKIDQAIASRFNTDDSNYFQPFIPDKNLVGKANIPESCSPISRSGQNRSGNY